MEKHERALQELRDWVTKEGGGLQIIFAGSYVSFVDSVPHAWQCTATNGRQPKELYHAYGVTLADAIIKCHQRWSDQVTGYQWKEVESTMMSLSQWFDYQQNKVYKR